MSDAWPRRAGWARVHALARSEFPYALEIAALSAFVFARPVLGSFGDAPEVFIALSAGGPDIVVFAVIVVFAPVVLAVGVGSLVRVVGERWRQSLHLVAIAGLGALAAWQILHVALPVPLTGLAPLGLVLGSGLALAWVRGAAVSRFLRVASLLCVAVLVQFLVLSPASGLIWDAGPVDTSRADIVEGVEAVDDPPPVVLLILDELPTVTLLDGNGDIDTQLYPNFARLAATSTWYRNHTTVAAHTPQAVGAIVGGRHPDPTVPPTAESVPDNLFTLLAPRYDVEAREQLTAYCPSDVCPLDADSSQVDLLASGVGLWGRYMVRGGPPGIPARAEDRLGELEEWIRDQDFRLRVRPGLFAFHAVLPHVNWEYLPDGRTYAASTPPTGVQPDQTWTGHGLTVGAQRHVLQTQTVDRVLGLLLDAIDSAGSFDDAVVVVTSDHGMGFVPGEPRRLVNTAQYDQIAWAPLFVKAPGQQEGAVSDANVQNVDILPTVLDLIGVEVSMDGGGRPADRAPRPGDPGWDDKTLVQGDEVGLPLDGDQRAHLDVATGLESVLEGDLVAGEGPAAAWEHVPGHQVMGRPVSDFAMGDPMDATLEGGLAVPSDGAGSDPAVLEVNGTAELADGTPVVAAVDGTIVGTTQVETDDGVGHIDVLLHPDAIADGSDDLRLYVAVGGDEVVLRPLEVG